MKHHWVNNASENSEKHCRIKSYEYLYDISGSCLSFRYSTVKYIPTVTSVGGKLNTVLLNRWYAILHIQKQRILSESVQLQCMWWLSSIRQKKKHSVYHQKYAVKYPEIFQGISNSSFSLGKIFKKGKKRHTKFIWCSRYKLIINIISCMHKQ